MLIVAGLVNTVFGACPAHMPAGTSCVDGNVITQVIINCQHNPGACDNNPNIRGPLVTGKPLDATYYANLEKQKALD